MAIKFYYWPRSSEERAGMDGAMHVQAHLQESDE
jgi:hypothetical protein